jgi:hypothetical protein
VGEDDVFQLDVPVDDVALMHVVDALGDLADDDGGGLFCEALAALEEVEEVSVAGQL